MEFSKVGKSAKERTSHYVHTQLTAIHRRLRQVGNMSSIFHNIVTKYERFGKLGIRHPHGIDIQKITTKNLQHRLTEQGGSRLWPWSKVVKYLKSDVIKTLIVTYYGGCLSFVELSLQARDAESNIEKINCVAGPGKPSTPRISFGTVVTIRKDRTRSKTVPIGRQ